MYSVLVGFLAILPFSTAFLWWNKPMFSGSSTGFGLGSNNMMLNNGFDFPFMDSSSNFGAPLGGQFGDYGDQLPHNDMNLLNMMYGMQKAKSRRRGKLFKGFKASNNGNNMWNNRWPSRPQNLQSPQIPQNLQSPQIPQNPQYPQNPQNPRGSDRVNVPANNVFEDEGRPYYTSEPSPTRAEVYPSNNVQGANGVLKDEVEFEGSHSMSGPINKQKKIVLVVVYLNNKDKEIPNSVGIQAGSGAQMSLRQPYDVVGQMSMARDRNRMAAD